MAEYIRLDDRAYDSCGVVGVHTAGVEQFDGAGRPRGVAQIGAAALWELQNRGEDGAGLLVAVPDGKTFANNAFLGYRGEGLINEVIHDGGHTLDSALPGASIAVAHTRYPTSGSRQRHNSEKLQPLDAGTPDRAVVLGHNGNIPNAVEVAMEYGLEPPFHSDTHAVVRSLDYLHRVKMQPLHTAALELFPQFEGGYAFVFSDGHRLYAGLDPWGFRPLSLAGLPGGGHMLASERPAFDPSGAKFIRDIKPGEIVAIDGKKVHSYMMDRKEPEGGLCSLEYGYFARPYGTLQGRSVSAARRAMGELLFRDSPVEADVVVGVPNSGMYAADGYHKASGIPLGPGLVKNEYETGRSFIQSSQTLRAEKVERKLRVDPDVVNGKVIDLVDDSVIRGTNMKVIIGMLRRAGAKGVNVLVATPPIMWPCFYGIDIGDPDELFARKFSNNARMAEAIHANSVHYNTVSAFREAIGSTVGKLCTSCMTGKYFTKIPRGVLPDSS